MHKRFNLLLVRQSMTQETKPSTAYCVKCRAKTEIKDPQSTTLKNGRPATKGKCSKCGTNVFRIGKS